MSALRKKLDSIANKLPSPPNLTLVISPPTSDRPSAKVSHRSALRNLVLALVCFGVVVTYKVWKAHQSKPAVVVTIPTPPTLAQKNSEALQLYRDHHWEAAAQGFAALIKANPEESSLKINFAASQRRAGKTQESESLLNEVMANHPNNAIALNNLAVLYLAQQKWSAALSGLTRARGLDPKLPEVHLNLGFTLEKLKRWQEASVAYNDYLNLAIMPEDKKKILRQRIHFLEAVAIGQKKGRKTFGLAP